MKNKRPAKSFAILSIIICVSFFSNGQTYGQGDKTINQALTTGWNWISINLSNPDMALGTVLGSLTLTDGDYIKNRTVSATWYDGFGWFGDLTTIDAKEMYKIKLAQADVLIYVGTPSDPCIPIPISTGWSWIGFPPQTALPIDDALSSINPVEGDYIKSYSTSSTFYNGFGWFGDLTHIEPLKGYMLKTSHAETLVFTACETDDTFIDARDMHVYKWVNIGTQAWMAENLAYLPSVVGSGVGSDLSPYYYVYGYEGTTVSLAKAIENYATYGVLYNWVSALTACPTGWHLPSDEEWKILEKYLGMSTSDADELYWRFSGEVGKKLKSTAGWYSDGNGDNTSGFNALPGGERQNAGFTYIDEHDNFWSSSPNGTLNAWYRGLAHSFDGEYRFYSSRSHGYSVRCLQD